MLSTSSKTHERGKWPRTRLRVQKPRTTPLTMKKYAKMLPCLSFFPRYYQWEVPCLQQRAFLTYLRWNTVITGRLVQILSLVCQTTSFPFVLTAKRRWLSSENFMLKKNSKWHIYVSQFAPACRFAKLHKIKVRAAKKGCRRRISINFFKAKLFF